MNLIISGCVRNCEPYIKSVFDNISKISERYNIIKIICSYDVSNDKTLLELCKQRRIFPQLEILINKDPLSLHRTVNISNARNKILDYIDDNNFSADYLIMMDFDDVSTADINVEVLANAFTIKDKWDILSFMNEVYYDYWALSLDKYVYSCWHNTHPLRVIKHMKDYLYNIIDGVEYIECISSFNGFCIFNIDSIRGIRYKGYVNSRFYTENYTDEILYVENETSTTYKNRNENIYDCEHRYYQIMCKNINKTKNIIFNQNIFKRYYGRHSNIVK